MIARSIIKIVITFDFISSLFLLKKSFQEVYLVRKFVANFLIFINTHIENIIKIMITHKYLNIAYLYDPFRS